MHNFKKKFIYFAIFVIIIFIIPILCTRRDRNVIRESSSNLNNTKPNDKYDYKNYKKIRLLHKKDNYVEEIPLDEYLFGVVAAEMPANFEIEALKAQAVAARTYTIYQIEHSKDKHSDKSADLCDDSTCCQSWISKDERLERWNNEDREENWNKIVDAVNSTLGKIITYNKEPINAFFHSNSGGKTEDVSNVWGEQSIPYLKSVETVGETEYSQYNSEVQITKQEVIDKLKVDYPDIEINFDENDCIKILDYTESNRVKTVKFGNIEIPGIKVRSIFELKSTNFTIRIQENDVIFSVIGYGHGIGMSQTGADSMAKQGSNYEQILKHFYTGVEITNF